MPESAVVDANILLLALGYAWKGLTVVMVPIVWLFVGRVKKDNEILHKRVDGCEEGHLSMKESELKDALADEKNDRMISAIVTLEKTTKELAQEIKRIMSNG